MRVKYTTPNNRLTFEFEVQGTKAVMEALSAIQEVFEEPKCGCCKSERIQCSVAVHDNNKYYKLKCSACGAQFDFGQHKTGDTLFAKRREEGGGEKPNGGWYIYRGAAGGSGQSSAPQQQQHRGQHAGYGGGSSDGTVPF